MTDHRSSEVEDFEEVPPSHARKRIDGAIAYARNLGFDPHPDYRDASVVLDGIDPAECTIKFTYGKNGKPFYISGPNHTPEQPRGSWTIWPPDWAATVSIIWSE